MFTQYFPEFWLYVLGALFIAVTLFLPQGIVGLFRRLRTRRRDRDPELMQAGAKIRAGTSESVEARAVSGAAGPRGPARRLDTAHGAIPISTTSRCFDGFRALDALSLSISAGELRCIIGPTAPARRR